MRIIYWGGKWVNAHIHNNFWLLIHPKKYELSSIEYYCYAHPFMIFLGKQHPSSLSFSAQLFYNRTCNFFVQQWWTFPKSILGLPDLFYFTLNMRTCFITASSLQIITHPTINIWWVNWILNVGIHKQTTTKT